MTSQFVLPDEQNLQQRYPMFKFGIGSYGGLQLFRWDDSTSIEIGNYCSFAFGTKALLGGGHRPDWVTMYPFSDFMNRPDLDGHPASKGNILIGHDVWVGAEAMILSGVTIGTGAVIAARSVVTEDVEPYDIVGGSPAKHIKWRFPFVQSRRLMKTEWWYWSKERIEAALPLLLNPDIEAFINAVEQGKI